MKIPGQNTITSVIAAGALAVASSGALASEAADDIIDANSVGGSSGYLVKRLNSSVIDSRNPDFPFYPASSIKVLQHLAAMRLVQDGKMNLDTTNIEICENPKNCGDGMNSDSGCQILNNDLRKALTVMMVNSGNKTTNAIQEFVGRHEYLSIFNPAALGRQYMNDLGQNVIGYGDNMQLNHKFACDNVANNPANVATLTTFSALYEAIGSREDVITQATRLEMKSLMLNEANGFFTGNLSAIISAEANDLGKNLILDDFKDAVRLIYKGGSLPSGYLSLAGMIQLPINNGTGKRIYTFSSFIENADIVINGTTSAVAAEVLRPVIRSALQSWNQYTQPGLGYINANKALGNLEVIALDMPDDTSRSLVESAMAEMKSVKGILSEHLPDNYAAAKHIVTAVGALEKVARYDSEGNLDATAREIVSLAAHLSGNAMASARGESLDPRLYKTLLAVEADRQMADRNAYASALLMAAELYAKTIYDSDVLVSDTTGRGCTAYSESVGCPEYATAATGFPIK